MRSKNRDGENEALQAPLELISALKRSKAPIFVPPTVDEAILRAAQRQLTRRKLPGFKWLPMIRWGLAAALVLALAIMPRVLRKPISAGNGAEVRADLNHDGQVDILDAFALARRIKAGTEITPQWDINGDGVVDERDVAMLAARAVSLGKGGGS